MNRDRGIAYCGLACCVCSQNETCPGCRNNGCTDKEWCKNFTCCQSKELNGCWECDQFPCENSMLDKPKALAFATFAARFGEKTMMDCLAANERAGIVYHQPGTIRGDYDIPDTQEGIIRLLLYGK